MKKNRRHKPIGIIIYKYMEMSQENSVCSYLYLKLAKMSLFLSFFFYKYWEQVGKTGPAGGKKGVGGEYGTNTVYTCM
jgi:hypothetical protein